jgi:hypothetical protein
MGYRTSQEEIEDLMVFWRWVGHLMGVRPRWYPTSVREATQLVFLTLFKGAGLAGEDGVRLCQSYATAFEPREATGALDALRARVEHGVHRGFTRFFLPPSTLRRNALPPAGLWTLAPAAAFPLLFAVGSLRRRVPALDDATDTLQRRRRERWLARHMGARAAEFRPGERLTR